MRAILHCLVAAGWYGGALFAVAGSALAAIDAPHEVTSNTINCEKCHILATGATPTWVATPTVDNSPFNNLCIECHDNAVGGGIQDPKYQYIKTHSSAQSGTTKFGSWMIECRTWR
jgi:hypothetical protein